MGLKTTCSNCGTSFAMKNRDMEGKKVKCKNCGDPFVVKFGSGSGNSGGMPAAGGLPPKVVGQKPPRKIKPAQDEEAPAAKPGGSGNMKIFIIAGSLVGILVIWTGIMFALGGGGGGSSQSKTPEVVKLEMKRGRSEQGKYGVDYPVDWEFRTGGGTGGKPEFVRIETKDISISIKTNLKASAVGDISSAGGTIQDDEVPEELEPIAGVHEFMKTDMELEMSPYDEEPAEKIMAKAGNSRISKFVGDRGMLNGGKAYGFRATVPSGPDKLKVVIICESEKVFEKYEQTLRDIVLSIGGP